MRIVLYTLIFILAFGTISCKEETVDWAWCTDCQVTDVLGEYEGSGNHLRFTDSIHFIQKNNVDVTLKLSESGSSVLASTNVVNVFSSSISGVYDDDYYLQFSGNKQTFNATIWRKENQIKLVGTIKKTDSEGETLELLDFEVFRLE